MATVENVFFPKEEFDRIAELTGELKSAMQIIGGEEGEVRRIYAGDVQNVLSPIRDELNGIWIRIRTLNLAIEQQASGAA